MKFFSRFRDFIHRGNIIDLAVGVIIGGAFQKIVSSVVNDMIMPPLGLVLKGVNFKDIKVLLKKASVDENGMEVPPVTVNIGNFIQVLVEFLIIAVVIFLVVTVIHKIRLKHEEEKAAKAGEVTKEQQLLTEIRDILKDHNQKAI